MEKMCALNEDLFRKSNLDIPEGPVKVDGATNPVYTDALNQHAKRKKDVEKIMKDADKVDELETPFTGSTDKKNMPKKVEEPKMKLEESLFEDTDLDDEHYEVSRYLDVEIPDICKDTLDKIENMTAQQIKVIASKCRDFYNFLERKVSGMNEAYAYEGADQMGRAHCSPLVPDFSGSIRDYVKHYGEDEKYDSVIMSSLKDMVVRLLDSKQEVENFNAYWNERYPLLIKYIDDQIALVPFDVLNYGDGRVEEDLHEEASEYKIGDIVYKRKREPLADIVQDELTSGEWVYRYNGKVLNPTPAPSLNIDPEEIGVSSDDKGDFVIAWVETEDATKEVEDVAKKYGKEFISGHDRYVRGKNKFFTKIYMDEEDWDEPYFDPNVRTK